MLLLGVLRQNKLTELSDIIHLFTIVFYLLRIKKFYINEQDPKSVKSNDWSVCSCFCVFNFSLWMN